MIGACGLVRQLAEPFETEHPGLFNRISPEGGKTPRVFSELDFASGFLCK
jgi:hypothetical protein